jgi:aryl carrier-like protein
VRRSCLGQTGTDSESGRAAEAPGQRVNGSSSVAHGAAGLPPASAPLPVGAAASAEPPEQDLEARIEVVWTGMLGRPVDRHANLFDCGGNSLVAVRLHRRLRDDLGLNVKLTDIFQFPTIAQLASHMAGAAAEGAGSRGALRARRAVSRRAE